MRKYALPVLLILLSAQLCACGGRNATGDAAPAAELPVQPGGFANVPQGLPGIAELDRLSTSALEYYPQWTRGAFYMPFAPKLNVSGGVYSPGFNVETEKLENAFAIYGFDGLQDLPGPQKLELQWLDLPPTVPGIYVGLADYGTGRWSFRSYAEGAQPIGEIGQYLSGINRVYVAVLATGNKPLEMGKVIIGDVPPLIDIADDLSSNPADNVAPLDVMLDASGTEGVSNPPSSYDFDFDGDGVYDLEGDPDGIASHLYGAGSFTAVVRVHDGGGLTDTETHKLLLIDSNNIPPTAVIEADVTSGSAPLTVSFDPGQSSDTDGSITKYRWDFNGDGVVDLSKNDSQPVSHTFYSMGSHTVILTVVDNNLGEGQTSVQIELSNGWTGTVVAAGLNPAADLAVASIGSGADERAALACIDPAGGSLLFYLAQDVNGGSWSSAGTVLDSEDRFGSEDSLEMILADSGDRFQIAYDLFDTNTAGHQVHYVASLDETGSSWDTELQVNDTYNVYLHSLLLLNGKPCIGGMENQGIANFSRPLLYTADNATGSAWSAGQQIMAPIADSKFVWLDIAGVDDAGTELPVALAITQHELTWQQIFVRASDAAGSSWDAGQLLGSEIATEAKLASVSGNPALVWGSTFESTRLSYGRAQDSLGSDWSELPATIGTNAGTSLNLAMLSGSPVICFYALQQSRIKLLRAQDSIGGNWNAAEEISESAATAGNPRLLIVNDAPLVLYTAADSGDVICSWFAN